MTDRPILFSAPMVKALIDGRKTQTRRVLKPQPPQECNNPFDLEKYRAVRLFSLKDRLWVKETHFAHGQWRTEIGLTKTGRPARYFARVVESEVLFDLDPGLVRPNSLNCVTGWFKRPSLFMKRSDSRLTLTVTAVRVQRLQDISHEDAIAEGLRCEGLSGLQGGGCLWRNYLSPPTSITGGHADNGYFLDPRRSFQTLWDSLNASRAPWEGNPWIVAYTFTVQQCNIDQMDADK